jgi:C1A family cysteine protease
MEPNRGRGHILDLGDARDFTHTDLVCEVQDQSLILPVPAWGPADPSSNLMAYVIAMWDQKQTQSCVTHALGRASHMRGLIQGYSDMIAPNPYAWYALSRMFEKNVIEPLQDVGCHPRSACQMSTVWGLAPWDSWTLDTSKVNIAPSPDLLSAAAKYRNSSYYAITNPDRANFVRESLTAKVPVCAAFVVDKTFNNFMGSHVMSEYDGTYIGTHYVTIIGHDSDSNFLICNSWGEDWGFGGFAWISERRLCLPSTTDVRAVLVAPEIT